MVVDKDVEGLGEWTLGEVKQSGYVQCSSDGRLKVKGMSARLGNFLCTGRIMIGPGLNVVCSGVPPTPCWPASRFVTSSPFILQLHPCLSELPLNLGVRVSLNVSTFSLRYS